MADTIETKEDRKKDRMLDKALKDTMDASDVPAITQPGAHASEPAPSSGYDEEAEEALKKAN